VGESLGRPAHGPAQRNRGDIVGHHQRSVQQIAVGVRAAGAQAGWGAPFDQTVVGFGDGLGCVQVQPGLDENKSGHEFGERGHRPGLVSFLGEEHPARVQVGDDGRRRADPGGGRCVHGAGRRAHGRGRRRATEERHQRQHQEKHQIPEHLPQNDPPRRGGGEAGDGWVDNQSGCATAGVRVRIQRAGPGSSAAGRPSSQSA